MYRRFFKGWLHTGDIGMWLPNGALKIVDRKNNFFKLAQSDFISPEQIENVYVQHPLIKQVCQNIRILLINNHKLTFQR